MIPAADQRRIKIIAERLSRLSDELAEVLGSERSALQTRDLERLEQSTADKQSLLVHIDEATAQLNALLSEFGLGTGQDGFRTLCEQAGLMTLWQHIDDTAARCNELNQLNGLIMSACQTLNRNLIEVLTGTSVGAATYGASGRLDQAALIGPIAVA